MSGRGRPSHGALGRRRWLATLALVVTACAASETTPPADAATASGPGVGTPAADTAPDAELPVEREPPSAPPPAAGAPGAEPFDEASWQRRLDMLLGTWEGRATSTLLTTGEVLSSLATTTVERGVDGRFLVERTERVLQGYGTTNALGLWSVDAADRTYRYWRFDGAGQIEIGTMTFDDATRSFVLASQSRNLATGVTLRGEGVMRYVEDDEKRFVWTAYDADGFAIYEAVGHSRRIAR